MRGERRDFTKFQDTQEQLEIFENEFIFWLEDYFERYRIEDMKRESQSIWNGALRYIHKNCVQNREFFRTDILTKESEVVSSTNSAYNFDILYKILDIYIDMCNRYDKEVNQIGFYNLTRIDFNILDEWEYIYRQGLLNDARGLFFQKLTKFDESSLSDKLSNGKNPVGVIAILNRRHGWASPYVADPNRGRAQVKSNELARLYAPQEQSAPQIAQQDRPQGIDISKVQDVEIVEIPPKNSNLS